MDKEFLDFGKPDYEQTYMDLGLPDFQCQKCGSTMWYDERANKPSQPEKPEFSICCLKGKVVLDYLKQPPEYLKGLLDYRGDLDATIVQGIKDMLDMYNRIAGIFRMARDRLSAPDNKEVHIKNCEANTLICGGRLFQQYVVDAYTAIEEERLRWYRKNQTVVRTDLYKNVCDAVVRGDTIAAATGKRTVLPSSFTGGPRYMVQNYQDAMAICRTFGNPDIFITFTANPKWPEIQYMLQQIPGQSVDDRPDIKTRVFKMKLDQLMKRIVGGQYFGEIISAIYTIEFQKRGLPHAHILFWLHPRNKYPTTQDIDKIITAEIPSKEDDPACFDAVKQKRKLFQHPELQLTDEQIQSYCLIELEKILVQNGKYLSDFPGMPLPNSIAADAMENRLILEEMNYNVIELTKEHERCHPLLNDQQLIVYNHVLKEVETNIGGVYFVYGHGGTGEHHTSKHEFNKWLLQLGDGNIETICKDGEEIASWTRIPNQYLIQPMGDPLKQIVESTYPNLKRHLWNEEYLRERAILTPLNETVDEVNNYIVQITEGSTKQYRSSDEIDKTTDNISEQELMYPVEFLNSLRSSSP
ncbi:hypothetical protein QL285_067659 [Trifolium repens]|nr:hypothetical protein QL285_067659 [Trifolium repens]